MNADDWVLLFGVLSASACMVSKIAVVARASRSDYRTGLRIITILVSAYLAAWWLVVAMEPAAHDVWRVAAGVAPTSVMLWLEVAHSVLDW